MRRRVCINCGKEFTFDEEFFRFKGFQTPKRCPSCAAKRRGRKRGRKNKSCLLKLDSVWLNVPPELMAESVYLTRQDNQDREDRKEYITCLRFKIEINGQAITVYDQRNNNPDKVAPLTGDLAVVSLRVMQMVDKSRAYKHPEYLKPQVYQYLVLEESSMRPEHELCIDSVKLQESCLWSALRNGVKMLCIKEIRR